MELQDLNASLNNFPVPGTVREQVRAAFWDVEAEDIKNRVTADYYFDSYYSPRCQHFVREGGRHVSVKTHSDVARIAGWILEDKSRDTIHTNLLGQDPAPNERAAETSIDMCASLLAMVELGKQEFVFSGRSPMHWTGGSFRDCLARRFSPQATLDVGNAKLVKGFTGKNLTRIGGITIKWTTNLVDHLLLSDDDQALSVFHCASFLKLQQHLFNMEFIDEAIRTLALLFPQNDRETKRWLHSQTDSEGKPLDPALAKCGSLQTQERRFESFSFWRDRLVILKEAFDESRPKTLPQWWFDRRNGKQWYTFWIAVLVFVVTILFGIVQSVEGALQVYLSYKALQNGG